MTKDIFIITANPVPEEGQGDCEMYVFSTWKKAIAFGNTHWKQCVLDGLWEGKDEDGNYKSYLLMVYEMNPDKYRTPMDSLRGPIYATS